MLDQIPSEILSHITLQLSLPILSPPIPLLQTSRSINDTLSPTTNARLYARIFRANFDVSAAERRVKGDLNAGDLVDELRIRFGALSRLRRMVERGDVLDVQEKDLWVVYIMLIENDGKNMKFLTSNDTSVGFNLYEFLDLYHSQPLLSAALEAGYPAETVSRSLIMWIAWFLSTYGPKTSEPPEKRDERLFVLRPYVFAPQQYDLTFGPWTIPDLPLSLTATSAPKPEVIPIPLNFDPNPWKADLSPKSRLVTIRHYGRRLEICPPLLAHAAILRFFTKDDKDEDDQDDDEDEEGGVASIEISPFGAMIGGQAATTPAAQNPYAPTSTIDEIDETSSTSSSDSSNSPTDLLSSSTLHDRDFRRLLSCHDPTSSIGMPRSSWKGTWKGCWEGTFSFFDFDAFRSMLAGHARALYEGPFGEQAQVWRLEETFVGRGEVLQRLREEREEIRRGIEREKEKAKGKGKGKRTAGGVDGGDDEEVEGEEEEEEVKLRGLPLNGPMTNAGWPENQQSSTGAGLASAAAEAITMKETIRQQVEAIDGYEIIPDDEVDDLLNGEDGGEAAGVEMLLTGTGHSAWGRFILKGRVRTWDGMATLVKEYAPDSRGKWIYRGYVTAGDVFVGRWRDTFTPEAFIGYEGTFILNRR